jgi:hypothetical protein
VQLLTFISGVVMQNGSYNWVLYMFLAFVTTLNLGFILYIIKNMLSNFITNVNMFLGKYEYFRKFQFFKNFIARQRQRRLAMAKWVILRMKIKRVIQFGMIQITTIADDKGENESNFSEQIQSKIEKIK